MKKKLFTLLFGFMLLIPFSTKAADKDLVKVYVFEAGGCPYCEEQIKYLEGLDSYGEKFTIVQKELYVDHVDWEQGKDYELGVNVANGFNKAGFADASYQGTPFVVISDLYAAAAYSTSLESIINEAYEAGDKDIVGCYANGNTDCLDYLLEDTASTTTTSSVNTWVIIGCTVVLIGTYVYKSTIDRNKIIGALEKNKKNK